MSALAEAEQLALRLSDSERAKLAATLLASLPSPGWDDDDDGIEEALRRDREMDENPASVITMEQLDDMLVKRFPYLRK